MKIQGKALKGAFIQTLVLPRGDDKIVFRAQAVLDYTLFDKLCPRPEPAITVMRDGTRKMETADPEYQAMLTVWSERRIAYLVLQSLAATEGLEWETVSLDDPSTWNNYQAELRASGFTEIEIGRIIEIVMDANGMDDAKIKQATKDFLQQAAAVV